MEQYAGTLIIHNISHGRVHIAIDTAFGTIHLQFKKPSILMYISMVQVSRSRISRNIVAKN